MPKNDKFDTDQAVKYAATTAQNSTAQVPHELQCMEVWSGNRSIETTASSTGMEAWIYSQPYLGESRGGDVHYLSLCVGGIVTRIILADVSGHGNEVADTSTTLRKLLRRFMNAKKQDRLVEELNREFSDLEQTGRFATAVIATYQSHKNRLLLTNAGHPRPLLFRAAVSRWQFLSHQDAEDSNADNLPLGIDRSTLYQHFTISIEADDLLLLYTDAFVEGFDAEDKQLGEQGLLALIVSIPMTTPFELFGRELLSAVRAYSNGVTDDDETLMLIRFGRGRRAPGIMEKLRGYATVIRSSND